MSIKGMSQGLLRWVSDDQVRRVLTWDLLLPAVRQVLQAFTLGPDHCDGAVQPLRSRIKVNQHNGILLTMPGMMAGSSMTVKILTAYPDNSAKGLPSHSSTILHMDPKTGLIEAILEGNAITEMRTAAASAVATLEIMSARDDQRRGKDLVVAVLGAGAQAYSHARVMAHILKTDKVVVWARRTEAADQFCQTLQAEGIPAMVAATVQEAVVDADVINCCTATSTPLLQAAWIKPMAHINSVGAPHPDHQELEEELIRNAIVYTDSYNSAKNESGDVIKSGAAVYAEIGEILLQRKPVLTDRITIFKSLGLAVEDTVAAQLVCELLKAEENQ
ncbi:hypothetical protein Pcinc_031167 [Petrolisthes cinctipes]|uniref:Ketimine reductase mu-crystallin n=1 Tax=Petrolisthes cinctipes TaxID=88211 RepID=A0AAE1K4Y0_PETCI|nr:hypothetical protein Pcinc_031167 [Petrolisthes cinctipes]